MGASGEGSDQPTWRTHMSLLGIVQPIASTPPRKMKPAMNFPAINKSMPTTERPRIPRPRMIPAFCFTIALVAPQDLQTTASGWFSVMHREHWFMASPWGLGHARIGGGGPAEYGARSERGQDQPPTPQSPNRLIAYSPVLRYAARKSPAR